MSDEGRVWFVDSSTSKLTSIYNNVDGANTFKEAQPITAFLTFLTVNEDLDGIFRGENDVFVMSTSYMGNNPPVERVHLYKREVPDSTPIHQFPFKTVFASEDYDGKSALNITLRVLDIDINNQTQDEIVSALNNLVGSAGAVFPAVAPYTFAANTLIGIFSKLYSLIVSNDIALEASVSLLPNPTIGEAHLYEGTYVIFKEPINASGFGISNSGVITPPEEMALPSYALLNTLGELRETPKYIISQKIANLLTQITKENPNQTRQSVEFLSDTLNGYHNFTRLNRYRELEEKSKHTQLTAAEKKLREEISKIDALKPYLSA